MASLMVPASLLIILLALVLISHPVVHVSASLVSIIL